jgi:hypothetical protein
MQQMTDADTNQPGVNTMKHHQHFQPYTPAPQVGVFWAILTICAAAGIFTVLFLSAFGVLTK